MTVTRGDRQRRRASRLASATIAVKEPNQGCLGAARTPGKDEKPEDNQFYARDDKNEGTLLYNGTLAEAADSVFLQALRRRQALQDAKPRSQRPTSRTRSR